MIFAGPSVTVGVSMYVLCVSRLSEVEMVSVNLKEIKEHWDKETKFSQCCSMKFHNRGYAIELESDMDFQSLCGESFKKV
jgi:hypothetical protein